MTKPMRVRVLKSLFGRMLAIILIPLLLVQLTTIVIFYNRHWDTVTRYMATNLAADLATIVDQFTASPNPDTLAPVADYAWQYFSIQAEWLADSTLPQDSPSTETTYAGQQLSLNLATRLTQNFASDLDSHADLISVFVEYPEGVLRLNISRKRIFSTTAWLFIIWTLSMTILVAIIAVLYLRGQIRPIKQLATAAHQIGLGRTPSSYRIAGASEVRQVGHAFHSMYNRIQRQIAERTEMLAGVSHDLRTPLTRMKLALAMVSDDNARQDMQTDINEMQSMIESYLNFARGTTNAGNNGVEKSDLTELVADCIRRNFAGNTAIHFTRPLPPPPNLPLRSLAMRRAVSNLITNALTHGGNCHVSIDHNAESVSVIIDDDGPGIAREQRQAALKPFSHTLAGNGHGRGQSNGQNGAGKTGANGNSIGLGLSIAREAAVIHGGDLLLDDAPQGGLRARIQIPL